MQYNVLTVSCYSEGAYYNEMSSLTEKAVTALRRMVHQILRAKTCCALPLLRVPSLFIVTLLYIAHAMTSSYGTPSRQ